MKKGRPPNDEEIKLIWEYWGMGLGSPKIGQLVKLSSFFVRQYMLENGMVRPKSETLELRRKNGLNYKNITVPKKDMRL